MNEARILEALVRSRILLRNAGNPYHDPATGQFTGPGGGSGHARRRKRRKRRRERLRKDLHVQAAEIKADHRQQRKDTLKYERRDRKKLATTQRKEWAREVKQGKAAVAKGRTARERNEIRERVREDLDNLKANHKQERIDQRAEHLSQRETDKHYRKEEKESFIQGVRIDIREAGFKQKKDKARSLPAIDRKLTISPGRTHKAGNAESILRHCLRQLGLTRRWRAGKLTVRQGVRLLQCIREYGRAWLRHEAEEVVRHALAALDRGIRWTDAPGGFLHTEDSGIRASLGRFFNRAKQFVRETIIAGAIALLGPAPLTAEELEAADREGQKQEQYFDRFHAEATLPTPKPMSPKQFVARAERYADSGWQAAQRINRDAAIRQGVAKMERRVLGHPKTRHCDDCPPLAEQGWVAVGTLPRIGETECGPLCLCHFEYMDKDGNMFFQGKKGRIPSPTQPAQMEPEDGGVYPIAGPPR